MIHKKTGFKSKLDIAKNWLPRYTGTTLDQFGDYMLLTNFHNYLDQFAEKFNCDIKGIGKPMQIKQGINLHGFFVLLVLVQQMLLL